METKHTPGPWGQTGFKIHTQTGLAIANISIPDPVCHDVGIANAKLIAAAPDLLEALESVLDRLEIALEDVFSPEAHKWDQADNAARKLAAKAIAKAIGGD